MQYDNRNARFVQTSQQQIENRIDTRLCFFLPFMAYEESLPKDNPPLRPVNNDCCFANRHP
jgi:hypothetical protein